MESLTTCLTSKSNLFSAPLINWFIEVISIYLHTLVTIFFFFGQSYVKSTPAKNQLHLANSLKYTEIYFTMKSWVGRNKWIGMWVMSSGSFSTWISSLLLIQVQKMRKLRLNLIWVFSFAFEFLNSELASKKNLKLTSKRNSELGTRITIHLLHYYSAKSVLHDKANSMRFTRVSTVTFCGIHGLDKKQQRI